MVVAPLVANIWWTKHWLMRPLPSRWRHAIAALASTILWIYCGYASTRVIAPSGGVEHVFASNGLAYFCVFMAMVSVIGGFLGLLLWTEEEGERVAQKLPDAVSTEWSD